MCSGKAQRGETLTSPATWELCLAVLTGAGYREVPARAIIGRLVKQYQDEDVAEAFQAAAGKVDPVAYARKWLKFKGRSLEIRQPALGSPTQESEPPASPETARRAIERARNMLKGREPGQDDEERTA